MKSTLRSGTASAAVIGCTLLCLLAVGLPVAFADTAPATSTPSTTITTSIGGGDVAPSTTADTTTTTTLPPTSVSPTPVPDTAVPTTPAMPTPAPPEKTTATTLAAQQLADLLQGLNSDVAQAQAVNDYLAARALAASGGTGQPPAPTAGTADAVLVNAAAAQIQADGDLAGAQQRFALARHRIAQVAVALYLGEQVPHAGSAIQGSLGTRSAFLSGILDAEKVAAKQAKADLTRDTAAVNERRMKADLLVQARTAQLQTAALQAATAAQAAAAQAAAAQAAAAQGTAAQGTAAQGAAAQSPTAPGGAAVGTTPATAASLGVSGTPLTLLTQASPGILSPSVLSSDELAGWFATSHHQPNLTVPLPVLAGDYETVGAEAGVRADIAFAQSVLETSYFGFPSFGQVAVSDNNFAGIGACDSCSSGYRFPDALTGVTAQMQLLHAYATKNQPFPGPLPGPFRVAGCCATWMALTGVWATAPDYGIKILKLYRSMVQWALAQRTAAAHL